MELSGEDLKKRRAWLALALDKALRADTNIYSIGTDAPKGNFVYFCGTFTSHSHTILHPWMARLRHLLRKKGYQGPIFLPDDRFRTERFNTKDGIVWQNNMLRQASHVVVSLSPPSQQEEVFTAATLGMILARREFATEKDQELYVFDTKHQVGCLQLRYRLGSAGFDTHHQWTTLARAVIRSRTLN